MFKVVRLLFFLPLCCFSKLPESYYQMNFANEIGGLTEVAAQDGTRCDILTENYAIEVDFAKKWGESIGQSLHYALQFNRKAGILLILEKPSDERHLEKIKSIIVEYKLPIRVWVDRIY